MSGIYVVRQPILDAEKKVFAYEVGVHQGIPHNRNNVAATEKLLNELENDIGFQTVVGKDAAIVTLPAELTHPDHYPKFESSQMMVQVANDVLKNIDVLRNLREAKSRGMGIVLADYNGNESSVKLSSICDYVKINVEDFTEVQLKNMLFKLHNSGHRVIAEQVATEEMYDYLVKLGFDFFKGYFFTNPVMINGAKLSGNRLSVLQLMAKINVPDTDFEELSEIISQDVGLSHKLLVAINNPANMIPVRIENIADAVRYMGLKRLKFWVNILMLSGMDDAPKELLITSLIRARFCEMLAEDMGKTKEKDSFFLVGLLSTLDAFFRVPIAEILTEMPLAEDLALALTHQEGKMGEALHLLECLEQANDLLQSLELNELSVKQISQHYLAASSWAQQVIAN